VSQQDNSRAAVERLLGDLAATKDLAHATALASQIKLHAELAGLNDEDVAKLAEQVAGPPARQTKTAKTAGD
jgi:hypothetical protein